MKKIIFLLTFLMLLSNASVKSENIKCKYIVGNGTKENPLSFTGYEGEGENLKIKCDEGTSYDCRKECEEVEEITIEILNESDVLISGNLQYLDVYIDLDIPTDITYQRQPANNSIIPSGYFLLLENYNQELTQGTKIIVDGFQTDNNGYFSIQGKYVK